LDTLIFPDLARVARRGLAFLALLCLVVIGIPGLALAQSTPSDERAGEIAALRERIRSLREQAATLREASEERVDEESDERAGEIAALRERIRSLREQAAILREASEGRVEEESDERAGEIAALRERIRSLREQAATLREASEGRVDEESDERAGEIAALRERIRSLREQAASLGEAAGELLAQGKLEEEASPSEENPGAAGEEVEFFFKQSSFTRWEKVKKILSRFFRAYIARDLHRVLAQFSPSAAQAILIFRNAILRDFQREVDISLDVELLEYRSSPDTLEVRFRWNRHATDVQTGLVRVLSGIATFWLDRNSDFRIVRMTGAMPFGIGDPDVQKQARAGQASKPLYLTPEGLPGSPEDPQSPAPASAPPVETLSLQLVGSFPNNPVDIAAINFETGQVRKVLSADPLIEVPLPGEDLFAYVYLGKFVGSTPVRLRAVNGAALSECGAPSFPLLQWKDLSPAPVGLQGDTARGSTIGLRTGEGNHVIVDFPSQATANYLLGGSSPIVNPVGQESCP
jgi:polyhydroxyalkanoate synthesis regulator phasin